MSRTLDNVLILSLVAGGVFLYFSGSQIYGLGMLALGLVYFIWAKRAGFMLFAANAAYRNKGLEAALNWMRRAYKTKTMEPRAQVTFAYQLLKQNLVEESRSVLDTLISRGARDAGKGELQLAWSYRALVQWKEGELEQAIATLERLLEDGYHTSALFGSLGYFLLEKGNLDRALTINLQALEFSGQDKVILDNLGYTYYLRGENDKALDVFERLKLLNPGFPEAWYNYASALRKAGRLEEARGAYEKALSLPFNALTTVSRDQVDRSFREISS